MTIILFSSWIVYLATINLVAGAAIVKSASHGPIEARNLIQGWSLQTITCPVGTLSCNGAGFCCPSTLFCEPAANDQVSACCTTENSCRGQVENSPRCADSSWSLWKGYQGNDFCCEVGKVGIYDYHNNVAGKCVLPADAVSATSAQLVSTAFGATKSQSLVLPTLTIPASISTKGTTTISSTVATTTCSDEPVGSASSSPPGMRGKPVFFHYMIGSITDAHCEQDIKDAMSMNVDAFALNINTVTESWATDTVTSLFKWANTLGFKLFFSFDMTGFNDPSQFTSFLASYLKDDAHFKYNGLPLVSTFNGGTISDSRWKDSLENVMANAGTPVYFVPAFQDVAISSSFFATYPSLSGAMNWNSWPQNTDGDMIVHTADDQTLLNAAHSAGKTMMMGISPLQFKHLDAGDNWYRRGEQNLEYRFGQVLSIQPDMIEFQTWNDAGESHYMGNSWPEPIANTPITAYTQDYDHTGYSQILPAFITAWKAGATDTSRMYPTNNSPAQGTFWHHTLLAAGSCPRDSLGPPAGVETVEDRVTAVVLVAQGHSGLQAVVTSGGTTLGTQSLVEGFNGFSFDGMTTGKVTVQIQDSHGKVLLSRSGPIDVASEADLCNYNFQVVALV